MHSVPFCCSEYTQNYLLSISSIGLSSKLNFLASYAILIASAFFDKLEEVTIDLDWFLRPGNLTASRSLGMLLSSRDQGYDLI